MKISKVQTKARISKNDLHKIVYYINEQEHMQMTYNKAMVQCHIRELRVCLKSVNITSFEVYVEIMY